MLKAIAVCFLVEECCLRCYWQVGSALTRLAAVYAGHIDDARWVFQAIWIHGAPPKVGVLWSSNGFGGTRSTIFGR